MPAGDRTGPEGFGAMTGRRLGYCTGNNAPGYTNPSPGRGMGRGYGRGMGRGFRAGRGAFGYGYGYAPAPAAPTKEQEMEMLKSQAKDMEQTLNNIHKRIDDLSKEK